MIKPGTPVNEAERLTAVQATGLLDSPFEERFDRIARVAQRLFDVPIALVSIVDENRQWFKSCIGLPVRETSREISFCGHAILGNEVFVIEDAEQDERFADNPLVIDAPLIRFYAGYPLRMGKGGKLGTLCIIDTSPRRFGATERALLMDLGRIVESELSNLEISVTDDLTRLLNRRGFGMVLRNNLSISRRNHSASTLLFFDLNEFKSVNDNFGHHAGDQVLTDFANILVASFRASDVVARLGGDEFVVLLNNADAAAADTALEALRELIDGYNADQQEGLEISYSCGTVSFHADDNQPIDDLMAEADRRMYANKAEFSAA